MTNLESAPTGPSNIQQALSQKLSIWGSELIMSDRYQAPEDPFREEFALHPNSPSMHSKWHQWGITHHMTMAGAAFEGTVPELLTSRVDSDLEADLRQESVDSRSKWDLPGMAVYTHDLGKFTKRQYTKTTEGPIFGFGGHEAESGAIIRAWHDRFSEFGLTGAQVEYIARCAELHFELGKLRSAAKQTKDGYCIAYMATQAFRNMAYLIQRSYIDYKREIGIIFLADSLAKTDVHVGLAAHTDEANEAITTSMEEVIATRGLSRTLLPAAKQIAINMAAGTEYLKLAIS